MLLRAALAFALSFIGGNALADPFASDWAPSLKSSARLLAGENGTAGVQVKLAPGAITYWRDPGDAGAPPTFDFSASTNLQSAEVHYPAPRRIAEADSSVAFGYDKDVLFPVALTPIDPAKPIRLKLALGYAVCEKICLPARASLDTLVMPGVSSPYAPVIEAARALTPKAVASDEAQIAFDKAAARLCSAKPLGADPTLFIEGPEGWIARAVADSPADGCFVIKVLGRDDLMHEVVHARLTFVGADAAYETTRDF
jgi:DsbC/DsbD-like thiol-disulfide interchange protein